MSVRFRLETAERAEREVTEPIAATTTRTMSGVGFATPSTRQHNPEVPEETLTPPTLRTAGGTSFYDNVQRSVRDRARWQAAQQEAADNPNPQSPTSALVEWSIREEKRLEAQKAAERAQRQHEQDERVAREKAAAERHVWMIGVNGMFDTLRATDAERARVLALPTVKVGMDPDKVGGILLTLRDATRSKPDWAAKL